MPERRDDPGATPRLGALDQLDLERPARPPSPVAPSRAAPPPRGPRRIWPWLLGLGLAALAIALALALARWREPLGEHLVPGSETNRQIQAAQDALAAGDLSRPDGQGARELFQAVLARDPDHPRARAGLAAVREAAVRRAREALLRGEAAPARRDLALARALAAPASDLADIEAGLRRFGDGEAGLAADLEAARAAQAAGRHDGPDGALAIYARVLARQPDNAVALDGRRAILSDGLARARALLDAGDVDAAAAEVARVVSVDPGHLELPPLQARLGEAMASREAARERTLAAAHAALQAGDPVRAGGDFAAMLAARPDDAAAADGLDASVAALVAQAVRAAADFDFDAADAALAQARAWRPAHPGIAVAERRLQQAREAQAGVAGDGVDADRLAALLDEARAAMRRGDFVEPPGASAWDRLRVAASLAPGDAGVADASAEYERRARACFEDELAGNRLTRAQACLDALEARDGVLARERRRLADRWLAFAEERLGANELDLARRAWAAARALDPAHPLLEAMAERLARAGG